MLAAVNPCPTCRSDRGFDKADDTLWCRQCGTLETPDPNGGRIVHIPTLIQQFPALTVKPQVMTDIPPKSTEFDGSTPMVRTRAGRRESTPPGQSDPT